MNNKILLIYILSIISLTSCSGSIEPNVIKTGTPVDFPITDTQMNISSPTPGSVSVQVKEYLPQEWELLYGEMTVARSIVDSQGRIWMHIAGGKLAYYDKDKWIFVEESTHGIQGGITGIDISPDGSIWVVGGKALSHFQKDLWESYPIPDVNNNQNTQMAIDLEGSVWLTLQDCGCDKSIRKFDGEKWIEVATIEREYVAVQLISSPDGSIWAAFNSSIGIGKYDGQTWSMYAGSDLWLVDWQTTIRIYIDKSGNVYVIKDYPEYIVKIDQDGNISRILFYPEELKLRFEMLRMYIDSQNRLWVNSSWKDIKHSCPAYYQDGQWFTFINLPFSFVLDINEMDNGKYLMSTIQGLYLYQPHR
jgi:streptogramin lyase